MLLSEIYHFFLSNFFISTIPPLIIIFGQFICMQHVELEVLFVRFMKSLLYATLSTYPANVGNQIVGVESDRINCPERPIVSGVLSIEKAKLHYIISSALFFIYGFLLNFTIETTIWLLMCFVLNHTKYGKSGFWKNIGLIPGAYVMICVNWKIANSVNSIYPDFTKIFWFFIFFTIVGGLIIPIQDLRDYNGDKKMGRVTFPVILGIRKTQIMLAIICILSLLSIFIYEIYAPKVYRVVSSFVYLVFNFIILMTMSIRLLCNKNDRVTYELFMPIFFNGNMFMLPILI